MNKHNINYVYLKGAALVARPYDVVKKRMMGDIDILISKKDIGKAKKVLIKIGYKNMLNDKFNFYQDILRTNHRHLKRIVHEDYIAAVELHTSLLKEKYKQFLKIENFLNQKIQLHNLHWVPKKQNLWKHNILNWHNDGGLRSNTLSLKSVQDAFNLESSNIDAEIKNSPRVIKTYYSLMSVFFDIYPSYSSFRKISYNLFLKFPTVEIIHKFNLKLVDFIKMILIDMVFIIDNKTFRDRVFKNKKVFLRRFFLFWAN